MAALVYRRRFLLGNHLSPSESSSKWLTYIGRYKSTIMARHVGVTQTNGFPFIITRERWYHRFLKWIGVASEINVGRPEFDDKYFLITDYPTHLEDILKSETIISSVQEIFNFPVHSLHSTSSKMWIVIGSKDFNEENDYYHNQLTALESVSSAVEGVVVEATSSSSRRKMGAAAILFLAAHAGVVLLGIFGALPTYFESAKIVDLSLLATKGLLAGAAFSLVWLAIIVLLFKKSSWASLVLADFVIFGLAGVFLSSVYMVREGNLHLPQAAPQVYAQPVTQKICVLKCKKRCGKRCTHRRSFKFTSDTTCLPNSRAALKAQKVREDFVCANSAWFEFVLEVKHWDKPTNYQFDTNIKLFDSLKTGTNLDMTIYPGAFSLEWIDTEEVQISK